MQLILWSDAEAEAKDEAVSDFVRTFTPKGNCQAAKMAAWFKAQPGIDLKRWKILVSPARRVQQTTAALDTTSGIQFETLASIALEATSDAILRAVKWPDSATNIIAVGHQPTLGLVIAKLLNGHDEPISAGGVSVLKEAMPCFEARWFETRTMTKDKNYQTILRAVATWDTVTGKASRTYPATLA